jgi:hypothetical protein
MPFIALDPQTAQSAPATTIGQPLTNEGETLASLRTELASELIRDIGVIRLNAWINTAYLHLASMITLSEMNASLSIPTIADQPLYMLPRSVAWIRQIPLDDPALYSIIGGRNMTMTDLAGYRELPDYPTSYIYSPRVWMRQGRLLAIWPRPNSAASITVDFRIRPDPLTLETHSPILPVEFHEPLLLRARYVGFRSLKMFNEAGIAQNDFVASLREIINTDAQEMNGKPSAFFPARELRASYRQRGTRRMRDYDL